MTDWLTASTVAGTGCWRLMSTSSPPYAREPKRAAPTINLFTRRVVCPSAGAHRQLINALCIADGIADGRLMDGPVSCTRRNQLNEQVRVCHLITYSKWHTRRKAASGAEFAGIAALGPMSGVVPWLVFVPGSLLQSSLWSLIRTTRGSVDGRVTPPLDGTTSSGATFSPVRAPTK